MSILPVRAATAAQTTLSLTGRMSLSDTQLPGEFIGSDDYISVKASPSENASALHVIYKAPVKPPLAWQAVIDSKRITVPDHKAVAQYRRTYQHEVYWISKILERANPFIGHIVRELDRRYLPLELALLPAVESSFRPSVYSKKRAFGLWQFMPRTADSMGIERNAWFDGRADVTQSTHAAMDYLSLLNKQFKGDWLLTLAAYNAGPGRVKKAIRHNRSHNKATDFWSLPLPRETREYVPRFLALLALMRHDKPASLRIPAIPLVPAFDVVNVQSRASLEDVAELLDISADRLKPLNTGLLYGVTPPQGPHQLNIPSTLSHALKTALAEQRTKDPEFSLFTPPIIHEVVAGDSLSAIAMMYDMPLQQLMSDNHLTNTLIHPGQRLLVGHSNIAGTAYIVSAGDTLSGIAQRFSIKVSHIKDAQGDQLTSDIIRPGDRLSLLAVDLR